jgi:hypothetical protein
VVGHLKVTDAKTLLTTEFVTLLDVDMLTATVNEMIDGDVNHVEFLQGMLIVVSRPVPTE